jgi:hypothetical protein
MRSAALIPILLAGCAALGGGVEDAKSSWQGAHYDEIVLQWGTSNRQATLSDGRLAHTWVAESGHGGSSAVSVGVFGGSGGRVGVGVGTIFGLPGMSRSEPQRCERTLIFENQRVVEQTWLGEPSFCSAFKKQ